MIETKIITLVCETEDCEKIIGKIKVYDYYATDFKRIIKHSNNYCLECFRKEKEVNKQLIKNTGEIKGFK